MGTEISHLKNEIFMEKYNILQKQFTSEVPLFDADQIIFPLQTSKMRIVDRKGRRVKLAGVNWSGCHATRHCVSGLQFRKLQDICVQIKQKLGFNCIRLTFSLQMYYCTAKVPQHLLKANPRLFNLTPMQILDITIKTLTSSGLMVILNNHTSKSMWCCTPWDGDGLWYTQEYKEQMFFTCLKAMAQRYKYNQRVIGMDLRNQVRPNWFKRPTWGSGDRNTDWRIAAETSANDILKIAPHWLIFVGSIDSQLDFTDMYQHPLHLKIPNRLVYTGHFYGFSWLTTIWPLASYQFFKQKLFQRELFVRGLQNGIPFLLGQFGSNQKDIPWDYLVRIMKQYDLDWTYWCLDGYKCTEMNDQTYGIYNFTYDKVRHQDLMNDLREIGKPIRK